MEFYKTWIESGHHGEMNYLSEHQPLKENPQSHWSPARSAFVFAAPYYPAPLEMQDSELKPLPLRQALYSKGVDYHYWFKEKLTQIAQELKTLYPDFEFLPMTDSSPVLERDLARRAGLGWFGKNTCLIHPQKGSLFFLGEIYSSLPPPQKDFEPLPDFCGTCTRCLEACPTQALKEPHVLDARLCISYWTIEAQTAPPVQLRPQIGNWFFGCDICQTVCPWNQKVFKSKFPEPTQDRQASLESLRFFLTASGKQISKSVQGTPLSRARPFGLRKNAMIVAANQNFYELKAELLEWKADEKLGELSTWAVERLIEP